MFVSFCKPSTVWSTIISFLTCLLWLLQGVFFNENFTSILGDNSLVFIPMMNACYSYPSHTPEVEGNLIKGAKIFITLLKTPFTALVLLHQKGAIEYELCYGQQPCLNDAIPPENSTVTLQLFRLNTTTQNRMYFTHCLLPAHPHLVI